MIKKKTRRSKKPAVMNLRAHARTSAVSCRPPLELCFLSTVADTEHISFVRSCGTGEVNSSPAAKEGTECARGRRGMVLGEIGLVARENHGNEHDSLPVAVGAACVCVRFDYFGQAAGARRVRECGASGNGGTACAHCPSRLIGEEGGSRFVRGQPIANASLITT